MNRYKWIFLFIFIIIQVCAPHSIKIQPIT
ncbi:hypothetical protein BN1805_04087 [Proteus vulgaris]|nr:hypothetical protein BN1805_04087 [Proteus vulgaris]